MNMKNIKGRRMPFENEIEYTRDLMENHPDPSAEWGGGDADIAKQVQDTAAGQIGVVKVADEEEYATLFIGIKGENDAFYKNYVDVSSDGTVALKADDSFEFGVQGNKGSFFAAKENDIELTPDYGYDVNIKVGNGGKLCVTQTGQGAFVKKEVALKENIPTKTSDLTNDSGFITGITSTDVTTALGYTPGTSNFSGDYDDLTDKPTIPDAVSGTNDGTNWTSLTIGNDTYGIGGGGGSQLYMHNIDLTIQYSTVAKGSCTATIISAESSSYNTLAKLATYLYSNGFTDAANGKLLSSSGLVYTTASYIIKGIFSDNGTAVKVYAVAMDNSSTVSLPAQYISDLKYAL